MHGLGEALRFQCRQAVKVEGDRSLGVGAASCGPIAYPGLQGLGATWRPNGEPFQPTTCRCAFSHRAHSGEALRREERWAHIESSRRSRLVATYNSEAALEPAASTARGEQSHEVYWKVQPRQRLASLQSSSCGEMELRESVHSTPPAGRLLSLTADGGAHGTTHTFGLND